MKITRNSCFETNSSSCHSISMTSKDSPIDYDTLNVDNKGIVTVLGLSEFGWKYEKYNEAYWKADYAYLDNVAESLIEEAIKTVTKCEKVVFGSKDGYIDHESYGTARDVCVDLESTIRFIFDKNVWLITDNDNTGNCGCYDDK